MSAPRHPLPVGSRVHHRACKWSSWFTPEEQRERPGWGWGTVVAVKGPYPDRSYEYEVQRDAPIIGDTNEPTWWASYHIDQVSAVAA